MRKQGTLKTWSQEWSDLYLQRQVKRRHDEVHGGGDEAVLVRGALAGSLGHVSGAVRVINAEKLVVLGALGHVAGHIVGTS